ncbi:GMC oxidoreductase [Effusibacillus consociatus]|uniref:GMC oxidoreductase n=2 Tax=Effusibacillus consociatus TaxID=1117041 RepID=A0ABV9Q2F4_9BACL
MEQTDYDVLIVGSGAGGGAVLWRLCERWGRNGRRIGMVEAGDLLLPTHAHNIPTMNGRRFLRYFQNPKISKPIGRILPQFSGAKQVFALGGRTLFWTAVSPRMPVSETGKWPVTGKEMKLYYSIAEQIMNVTSAYTKGSSITQLLLQRLRENGFPEADDYPVAVDLQTTKYGEIHSNVFFSSINFLAAALNRRPFDLAVMARAVRVHTERGKVTGLQVMSPEKKSYFLKTRRVILSGSTFETPRLLLHSGIQGRSVGHYLANHSFIIATGQISRRELPEVLGTLGILIPQTEVRPYQFQIYGPGTYLWYQPYEEKPLQDVWQIFFQGFGKVESRFENQVFLDPRRQDEYGVPEIQVNFSYSEKDQAVIRQMTKDMQRVASAIGARLISKEGQPPICLNPPGLDFHESGTCRMGDDGSNAAVNRYGEIFGVSGLYVADNSVLPSTGAANPTLTTIALAIRTADYVIRQLK